MKLKKVTALIMSAILSAAAVTAVADDTEKETRGDFVYNKGSHMIVGYVGNSDVCEIPDGDTIINASYKKSPAESVTKVIMSGSGVRGGFNSFFPNVTEVEFKDGTTEIGINVLQNIKNVETVIFPSSLKKIGDWAFMNCTSLKTVDLPDGLEIIGRECFAGCSSLSGDLTIPDTVTGIGYGVFTDCGSFGKVHISENASYTRDEGYSYDSMAGWFGGRTSVGEINIPTSILRDKNYTFNADEITFNSDMTYDIYQLIKNSAWCKDKYFKRKTDKTTGSDKNFIIADNTLFKYVGTDKNPVVPEGVKTIVQDAFAVSDIDSVTLPESLETIEYEAFVHTTLKEITIPKNVKTIGDMAFADCPLLEKAVFKGDVENIGVNIFNDSVWLGVDYKDNIIFESGKDVSADLYANYMMYNLKDFCEYMNKAGGFDLKYDEEYITSPSYFEQFETLAGEKPETTVSPRPASGSSAASARPQASSSPKETAKPAPTATPDATSAPERSLVVESGDDLLISVGGVKVTFPDAKPFIDENDRTQIPVRAVAQMLGCTVDWNGAEGIVTITDTEGNTVILQIGSNIMTVNTSPVQMDTAAVIKEDRTYIPVRFVAEALGLTVDWK